MNVHTESLDRRNYWAHATAVFLEWIRKPSQVASLVPSSSALTRRIADRSCVREASKIVELGPGTGGTTEALLSSASPNCRVLAIEKAANFIGPLKAIGDPRLIVENDDVVGLGRLLLMHEMTSPDVIVSGIPFSCLSQQVAFDLIKSIHRNLADGGTFVAYQFRRDVAHFARPHFGEPNSKIVWFNFPPLRVFTWTKPTSLK
ncbi:phospholipid N-methyltransferase [Rhodopirellula rubra]|uniref:Phospholipid N-methyltransferase n=1 Tax=Aporhodopirellula rubra TaxID=980271 RepID=A0A7W5H8P9_9BACT|nr:rRNA adenine N-6-methyltransferase family protein [Aporhodopirellula rubra]MBB3209241.1 phospholipid N-methyltransferase [Aporhodopirellula rubra]